jgi:type VII secretion protein EccB
MGARTAVATRKDQLDAFVYARRRMVANLIVPSPTGSDEYAPRPVKTFVASAVLSALAVAAVAVLGVFKPSAPSGWQNGLAVDSASGQAYVYSQQDHELHAVANITSARLILGSHFQKFDVPDSVINSVTIGPEYGIVAAPPDVPAPGSVDLTAWTLCVQQPPAAADAGQVQPEKTTLEIGYGQGGLAVLAPPTPDSPVDTGTALIVHDPQGADYLVDGDYAYPITNRTAVLALSAGAPPGIGGQVGALVSAAWLSAFAPGSAVTMPEVADLGDPVPADLDGQPGARIGEYGAAQDGDKYIQTAEGLVQVDDFVYTLYSANPALARIPQLTSAQLSPAEVNAAMSAGATTRDLTGPQADWPTTRPTIQDLDGGQATFQTLCANYQGTFVREGGTSVPHLEIWHGTQLPHPLTADEGVGQSGGQLADVVDVLPGHGAYSREVSNGASADQKTGGLFLTVDNGVRYQLATNTTVTGAGGQKTTVSAVQQLQYGSLTPEPVPESWMQLIQSGAVLDPAVAGTTPTAAGQ